MNAAALLTAAGVPAALHASALASLARARAASGATLGAMTWRKHWARLFCAGKIARALPWTANRLLDVRPDWAAWDIAPMLNITAHGDNVEWINTPDGGRPNPNSWLDSDPDSEEYKRAVAACYWAPGQHPRSAAARAAWYRRNAGEYVAWERGSVVAEDVQEWQGGGITVLRSADAWQITGTRRLLGPIHLKIDVGYEVGNVFGVVRGRRVQCWYPLPGHLLRACVVWVVYPVIARH